VRFFAFVFLLECGALLRLCTVSEGFGRSLLRGLLDRSCCELGSCGGALESWCGVESVVSESIIWGGGLGGVSGVGVKLEG
jgi:hypothetical protein